jgi:hypothetical protein
MLTKPKRNREQIPVMTLMMENETPKFCSAHSFNTLYKCNPPTTASPATMSDHACKWVTTIKIL